MRFIPVLLFSLVILACKCPGKAVQTAKNQDTDSTGLTLLLADNYGGAEEEGLQLIRDNKALHAFFGQVNKTRKPGLPVPEVDFTTHMVVVYSAGVSKGNLQPQLLAKAESAQIVLRPVLQSVNGNTNGSQATITPFVIYTLPQTEKNVILEKIETPK